MSHNRIPIFCLVLLALTASAFIATQLSSGQAPKKDNSPLKMKVLRDKAHVKYSPGQMEVAAFRKTLPQENERQLINLIPKHVPVKIKIKKEKEAGFKDLSNEKWAREFELEVTNTGTKPIYSLYLIVITDVTAAAGFRIEFPLYYGRDELGDIRTKAEATDVPIKPGESVSLQIHASMLDAWDYKRKKENRPFPKRLEVKFQFLSFGMALVTLVLVRPPFREQYPKRKVQRLAYLHHRLTRSGEPRRRPARHCPNYSLSIYRPGLGR